MYKSVKKMYHTQKSETKSTQKKLSTGKSTNLKDLRLVNEYLNLYNIPTGSKLTNMVSKSPDDRILELISKMDKEIKLKNYGNDLVFQGLQGDLLNTLNHLNITNFPYLQKGYMTVYKSFKSVSKSSVILCFKIPSSIKYTKLSDSVLLQRNLRVDIIEKLDDNIFYCKIDTYDDKCVKSINKKVSASDLKIIHSFLEKNLTKHNVYGNINRIHDMIIDRMLRELYNLSTKHNNSLKKTIKNIYDPDPSTFLFPLAKKITIELKEDNPILFKYLNKKSGTVVKKALPETKVITGADFLISYIYKQINYFFGTEGKKRPITDIYQSTKYFNKKYNFSM
jgi:hypothetical protein